MSVWEACKRVSRAVARVSVALAVACTGGCEADQTLSTIVSGTPTMSPYSAMAFTATVDARTRAISIAPPLLATTSTSTASIAGTDRPSLSLLGSDVVRLIPSNVRVSALGAFNPNTLRVTFDVTIENKLTSLVLVTPTWPAPPAPAVILFPLDYAVTRSPGGAAGGDGNTIGIGLPGDGAVTPSLDWNGTGERGSGAPFNFFTSSPCTAATTTTCFRWIAYGARLLPNDGSMTRTVGFDIDPSVAQFRARMIVAADLAPTRVP